MWLQYKSFENTVGKGEIARNDQFPLFPQCFLPFWRTLPFLSNLINVVCKLFQGKRVQNVSYGKGLTLTIVFLNSFSKWDFHGKIVGVFCQRFLLHLKCFSHLINSTHLPSFWKLAVILFLGILPCWVVKCMNCNFKIPQVKILWVFLVSILWQDTSATHSSNGKTQEIHEHMNCHCYVTEIALRTV